MEIMLFGLLALLLVFMVFNTRRRAKQMKAEQEAKAAQTIPGAKVLLQGGIFGTVVSFDADDLDAPALVEIAPGTVIEVHSQAILRVVDPVEESDTFAADDMVESGDIDSDAPRIETAEETRARLERDADDK